MDSSPCKDCSAYDDMFPNCVEKCNQVKEYQKDINDNDLNPKGIDTEDSYKVYYDK